MVDRMQIAATWGTFTGSRLLCRSRWFLDYLEGLTLRAAEATDQSASAADIGRFIEDNGVDVKDLDRDVDDFATLNEFFSRPLRAGSRPLAAPDDPAVVVSPADARVRCVEVPPQATGGVVAKGRDLTIRSLLGIRGGEGDAREAFCDAAETDGWSALVCRLAPGDYHRFHWPVDAVWSTEAVADLAGEYHSVAATAALSTVDVFGRNRRVIVPASTNLFGDVMVAVIGAVKVGSVRLTGSDGRVTRGDELGLFAYGGSTVVVAFSHDRIVFDDDLVSLTADGGEVLLQMGNAVGRAVD